MPAMQILYGMGLTDSHGPASSETPPPPWWTVDGAAMPLESLETAPLPDEINANTIKKLHEIIRSQARELRLTRERLEEELRHRYGRRSEKCPGARGGTGATDKTGGAGTGVAGDKSAPSPGSTAGESETGTSSEDSEKKKPGHGRRPIPPDLPQKIVEIPPGDGRCPRCGGPTHHLEDVDSPRFDYVPGYLRVVILRRSRRACDDTTCTSPFSIVKLPPEPIPKSRATAGFLAHLLVAKFADHCPLYRFAKILERQKVDLPRSTLVDYCKKSTDLVKPLWELMKKRVLESAIVQTDDTHVQVRLPRKKGVLTGHLWAYKGDDAHPYVVLEFTPNWEGKAPQAFLSTFEGYIQADGYKGYDELFKNPRRIEVGCMAHSRRKWVKAQDSSRQVADQALELFGGLYAIEEAAKDLSCDERKRVRQEQAAPLLEKLRVFMDEHADRVLPKSPVAKAIAYARNQWRALTRYLEDGRLSIDNNAIERELRRVALGRKNWLAAGSEVGGETAAVGYTMIASAIACDVEPVEWLTDVLERIVTCPTEHLEELLPDRWKVARPQKDSADPGSASTEGGTEITATATPATDDEGVYADAADARSKGSEPPAEAPTEKTGAQAERPPSRSIRPSGGDTDLDGPDDGDGLRTTAPARAPP